MVNSLFKDLATVVHSEAVCGNAYGVTNTEPVGRNKMRDSRAKTKIVINVPVIFNDQIYALDRSQLLKRVQSINSNCTLLNFFQKQQHDHAGDKHSNKNYMRNQETHPSAPKLF